MGYFIGIIPPDEDKKRIEQFRNRWASNRTGEVAEQFRNRWASNRTGEVAEPHITVKAQGGLTEDLAWLDRVREVCSSFPRFQLSLAEPETFGDAVVFPGVRSDGIHVLHRRLLDAVSPSPELIKRYYEGDLYRPHLTLGQTLWGMSGPEIMEMAREARTALAPWPAFSVSFVRVYKEMEPDKYVPFDDIPLAR